MPGLLLIAAVTSVVESEVTTLPNWSWISTTGCAVKAVPPVAPAGCVCTASCVAAPCVTVMFEIPLLISRTGAPAVPVAVISPPCAPGFAPFVGWSRLGVPPPTVMVRAPAAPAPVKVMTTSPETIAALAAAVPTPAPPTTTSGAGVTKTRPVGGFSTTVSPSPTSVPSANVMTRSCEFAAFRSVAAGDVASSAVSTLMVTSPKPVVRAPPASAMTIITNSATASAATLAASVAISGALKSLRPRASIVVPSFPRRHAANEARGSAL